MTVCNGDKENHHRKNQCSSNNRLPKITTDIFDDEGLHLLRQLPNIKLIFIFCIDSQQILLFEKNGPILMGSFKKQFGTSRKNDGDQQMFECRQEEIVPTPETKQAE